MPETGSIVPTPGLTLLHVPDGIISDKVVVLSAHTLSAPVIGKGDGFIVTVIVAEELPHGVVTMQIIVKTPGDIPVVIPVADPIVATPGALLLHVITPAPAVGLVYVAL